MITLLVAVLVTQLVNGLVILVVLRWADRERAHFIDLISTRSWTPEQVSRVRHQPRDNEDEFVPPAPAFAGEI